MVNIHQAILALLVLQVYVSAAPSSTSNPEDTTKTENGTLTSDNQPSPIEESEHDSKTTDNERQKRFYNHYGYGFPPINPIQYPTHNKRDQTADLGVYGIDDPLSHIHRRLQEIASIARHPAPPPPPLPTHFPFFFPVIFVPQQCACTPNTPNPNTTNPPTAKPDTSQPAAPPPVDGGTDVPDIFTRWPEMDDVRQNWGLVVNETDYSDEDFSRPISFDPIVLNTSMSRPAPPVEHGSNQAGAGQSTTARPPSINDVSPQPQDSRPSVGASAFASSGPYPTNFVDNPREAPTSCDGAILSCCHQAQITTDCFAALGCPDPTSYGNPCDPVVILSVIGKYQQFYGVRKG